MGWLMVVAGSFGSKNGWFFFHSCGVSCFEIWRMFLVTFVFRGFDFWCMVGAMTSQQMELRKIMFIWKGDFRMAHFFAYKHGGSSNSSKITGCDLPFLPQSWKWKIIGPSNSNYLSNTASYQFHDYGRKSKTHGIITEIQLTPQESIICISLPEVNMFCWISGRKSLNYQPKCLNDMFQDVLRKMVLGAWKFWMAYFESHTH